MNETDLSLPVLSEREIYREYEHNRRLYLARVLLPVFAVVQFGVFFVSALFLPAAHFEPQVLWIFVINTAIVGIDAALHAVGILFVRRGRMRIAILCVIVPLGITVIGPALAWGLFYKPGPRGISPSLAITLSEMAATLILIVLAGLLTNDWRIVVGTTLLLNAYTLFILTNALQTPEAGPALRNNATLLLAFPIFVQWTVAGILLAAAGTYLQTLRELGDVRVAFARAQQLDQLKDQFIAHVNHELRSPLMAMQGYVELMLLTEDTLSPEEHHAYLERAKRAGDDLVALVMSILSVRRLEEDHESFEPVATDVEAALESAIHLIDPREGKWIEREVRVQNPDRLDVWAEPVRVRQILTNLLSNAVKYSPPGTPVEVKVQVVPAAPPEASSRQSGANRWQRWALQSRASAGSVQRQMVQITVRDYGLGIPPEELPLLFKRFVRLPRDLASNVPGNGLGLYLCQTLAEVMGGTIWAESTGIEGEGTTFYLQLPAPPVTSVSPEAAPAMQRPLPTPPVAEEVDAERATAQQARNE
jgi:signal transduction histidine kinase